MELTQQVGRRLRRHSIRGRSVQIKVRYADFKTITRSLSLGEPSSNSNELEAAVNELFQRVDLDEFGVRLVGVGVSQLTSNEVQQQLLFDGERRGKENRLDSVKDQLAERFGHDAIRRGTSIEHDINRRPDPGIEE